MPTYEYKCDQCGKFEHWQNITDDALAECPTCGGSVKRLISRNVNIIFKGPGFYVTDNRSGGNGSDAGGSGESKDSKESKSTSESSTEKSAAAPSS